MGFDRLVVTLLPLFETMTMTMNKAIIQTTMTEIFRNIIQTGRMVKAIRSEKKNCLCWFITYLLIICDVLTRISHLRLVGLPVFKQRPQRRT